MTVRCVLVAMGVGGSASGFPLYRSLGLLELSSLLANVMCYPHVGHVNVPLLCACFCFIFWLGMRLWSLGR
jgi:hypothetical protein